MHESTIQKIYEYMFKGLPMPLHIIGQDSCNHINVMDRNNRMITMKIKGTYKGIFFKTLSEGLFNMFNGKFTKEDTIIVDNNSMN